MSIQPSRWHAAAPLLALAGLAWAGELDLARTDGIFLEQAAHQCLAEEQASRLAAQRAASTEVKAFAEALLADQVRINAALRTLARGKGVTLPTAPDADHVKILKDLGGARGADFDRGYVKQVTKDHRHTVELFERAAQKAEDAEVRALAEQSLPALRHHSGMVESLHQKIGS